MTTAFTPATEVWNVAPVRWDLAKENEMSRRVYRILLRWIPFANEQFQEWDGRPNCGHFFGGSFWYQADTAHTSAIFAVLSKFGEYDESVAKVPRETLKQRAIQGIRYMGFTHDTGPADCVRVEGVLPYTAGKKWGGEGDNFFMASQNGRSIAVMAYAAWILWDDLDTETKLLVQNVIASYADRWSADEPRNGVYFDTQCEENAWTSAGIGAAVAMFPDHPHHEQWKNGFMKWAINVLTTYRDRLSDPSGLIDMPAGNRVRTVTFHPDYTAENHAFVHPSYLCAGTNLRGLYAVMALTGGQTVIPAALYNNEELYERTVKIWAQFDGLCIPVQGQDWWYNRQHERQLTHTILSVLHGNRDAARFARNALESVERIQLSNTRGCLLEERGEQCVINKAHAQYAKDLEHGSANDLMTSYLLYLFGGPGAAPSDEAEMAERLAGVYSYPYGNTIVHRRTDSFASFTWRNNVMAMSVPAKGVWQITPLYASYTGTLQFAESKGRKGLTNEAIIRGVERESILPFHDGFAATVTIARGARELLQHAAFLSLPNGATVYAEKFEALADCAVHEASTGIIGIRNENYPAMPELAPGSRTIYRPEGEESFCGFYSEEEPNVVRAYEPPAYVNVDNYIGYVLFGSRGVKYINKHQYPKWKGVEDILVLNEIGDAVFQAGERWAPFVAAAMPNESAAATAARSARTMLLETVLAVGDAEEKAEYAIALEAENYLVTVNFSSVPERVRASKALSGGAVNLYEGNQKIRGTRYEWSGRLGAFSSAYRGAACSIAFASSGAVAGEPSAPGNEPALDITVSDSCAIIRNAGSSRTVITVAVPGGRTANIALDAGQFETVELG